LDFTIEQCNGHSLAAFLNGDATYRLFHVVILEQTFFGGVVSQIIQKIINAFAANVLSIIHSVGQHHVVRLLVKGLVIYGNAFREFVLEFKDIVFKD